MSTEQLKNLVIDQISQIEDEAFLNAVKTILDSNKASGSTMILNSEQRFKVQSGLDELASGKIPSNEDLEAEEDQWLRE